MIPHYQTVFYQAGQHLLSLAQPSSPDVPSASSLEVKTQDSLLLCDKEADITIKYNVVGEIQGSVDVMYLVSSGGNFLL